MTDLIKRRKRRRHSYKTGEDIAMLEERKQSKKHNNENLCDRHWASA